MVFYTEAAITQISVHQTGNKLLDDPLILSDAPLPVPDGELSGLLMKYFVQPFEKTAAVYRFTHPGGDLAMNEICQYAKQVFSESSSFHDQSRRIAQQLQDCSQHAGIKPGALYVCHFNQLQAEGNLYEAIGIFKSESTEPFLKLTKQSRAFQLSYEMQGINLKKLDKGCIIFNTEAEEGYKVVVMDNTNRSEAQYWVDDFLQLRPRNDNFNQTHHVLSAYRQFVTEKMEEDFTVSKADKIDLLNRSIRYFRENEDFNLDQFASQVIDNPKGEALFKAYKDSYAEEMDAPMPDAFQISGQAVKKQARVFKSVLKLDKNFHIYIHGNRELIEQGTDPDGRKYYKIYFKEES